MAQTTGVTPVGANKYLDFLRGAARVPPVICSQLHDDFTYDGTQNIFAGATRESILFDSAADAAINMTAAPPIYVMTEASDPDKPICFVSYWTGYEDDETAYCFAIGVVLSPQIVAIGDKVSFGSAIIKWKETASA